MSPDAVLSSQVQVAVARSPALLPRQVVLLVLCLCMVLSGARAAEPWADPKLPSSDGLQLWLDGSRQVSFRQQHGPRWLSEGARVDRWFDGSGQHRDVSQLVRDSTPQFRSGGGVAWVHFDGRDDFLSASQTTLRLTNATVFIVAAPGSNPGDFRGLLALSEISRNDYTHGWNVDLGPLPGTYFGWLNVEGAGAGGAVNLMGESSPFGRFRVIAVTIGSGKGGVKAWIDGKAGGKRDRTPSTIFGGEILVGARFYSNNDELPHARGFFEGDIAEILVYDRALDDPARERVTAYLAEKYSALRAQTDRIANAFNPLVPVLQPPPAQMFVPGFGVRELPLELPNINCVKYRADGKLVALGYNGQIYLLSDKDGDGWEDTVEPFWATNSLRAPIGMALTPPGYSRGQGVFVAAKGKVALIVDTDGDGRADREIIVAEGWRELSHGVDALGVAVDKDGNVYFGLGAADFTNAYLVDRGTGRGRYDLKSERGTILKVSADFQRREIVCTGIRFPVALAFNSFGDLFCTDQEGATWLPNGNPLDELLHIQPGRHYGFPPRHPKYLPDVIDEPSTFDYAPQHQSTCGLNFNESVNGGPTFGPAWWAGDALVAGYSRGKLYRTRLVKTPAGYVAQNQLIAAMNMLTVDACVSPRGDLTVATHSGQPDWGSGPNGMGKLFKFRYEQPELPQPVAVWAASPTETWIAWDRPLTAEQARGLVKECAIAGGKYLTAGERFESLRPGYQVVQDQLGAPRFVLPVLSTQISPDGHLLILRTEARKQAVNYAVTLGRPNEAGRDREGGTNRPSQRGTALAQHATIDLAYSLNGVEALWNGATNTWTGWIPSFDMDVTEALTGPSPAHKPWRWLLTSAGSLTLRAQIDLWQMLRPAVQPGATLDYDWPAERVFLRFTAGAPFAVKFGVQARQSAPGGGGRHELSIEHTPVFGEWLPVELSIPTGPAGPELSVTWHTAEDSGERPLALHRLYLPWASPHQTPPQEAPPATPPELAGANWLNGRRIFFCETTACYRCHQLRGEGHKVGPDLSNLIHRDYASVRKDILEPNAALNPDHIAYIAETKDGESVTGVLQQETADAVLLAAAGGEPVRIPKSRIRSLRPSALSLMPEGLPAAIGEGGFKDLLAFLLTPPPEAAPLETGPPPVVRSRREMDEIWKHVSPAPATNGPLRILLVDGPKDHGPDEHDYPLWKKRWAKLLELAENVTVTAASGWPSPEQIREADVMVFYSNNPDWSKARAAELDEFQKRGGGLVYLHFAVDGHRDVEALSDRIGLAWRGGTSKFRHGALDLTFPDAAHPITRGFSRLHFHDESYWNLVGAPGRIHLLASGVEEGAPQPLLWAFEKEQGRVFVSILGHYTWTFDDPAFRILVLRGICWAARQPEDRLSELALVGARIGDSPSSPSEIPRQ